MPWDDSGPVRLVPFHPPAPLAVSLSSCQPFWSGPAFSPCTLIIHTAAGAMGSSLCQWCWEKPEVFHGCWGHTTNWPSPSPSKGLCISCFAPKPLLVSISKPSTLESNSPWLAAGHARLCPPLPALSTKHWRGFFLRAVCVEFPILGWRGFSFSAAKYFDSLPSRSLAQCDMLYGDSPLGSPPRLTTRFVPAHRVLPVLKQAPIGQPQPSQGEPFPAQTPEMGKGAREEGTLPQLPGSGRWMAAEVNSASFIPKDSPQPGPS